MMKRTLFILLLILGLMLVACGGAEEPTEAPAVDPTEAPAEEPTEEPAEAPAEEPTEEPAEEPTEEPAEEPTEEPAEEEAMVPNVLNVAGTANVTTWDPVKSFPLKPVTWPTSMKRFCELTR